MICTSCLCDVSDRLHYQTELHKLNAKRKINGIPPLTTLPTPTIPQQEEEKVIKHSRSKVATPTHECFFCNAQNYGSLYDHINTHLPYTISLCSFTNLKIKFDNLECIFCSRNFSDRGRLKTHHLMHVMKKEDVILSNGNKIIKRQNVFESTQIRRPIENTNYQIVKVEVEKKRNLERSMKVKNDIKVSLMLNYQKHFTEHWRQ